MVKLGLECGLVKHRSLSQLGEQFPGIPEIGGVEALGEPAVDGREHVARLAPPTLVAPQPGEARRGAQFVAPRALLAGDRQGSAERVLGRMVVVRLRPQRKGFGPSALASLHRLRRDGAGQAP